MIFGMAVWVGVGLAVAAVVLMTPRNKDEWYHKEAGYGKPYRGEQRSMGFTYTLMFTSAFLSAAFGMVGWVDGNLGMMALAAGCFVLALVMLGLSTGHDRKDAGNDGIRVDYNQNGGVPGFLAVIVMICLAALAIVVAGAIFLTGGQ